MISIWFFIGVLLLAYGVIILGASTYYAVNPPEHPLVLANLHAGVYWGALLMLLGGIYTIKFRPGSATRL
ncbi:hypothetical protein [Nevskia soli]|uniref:hypothetical protein n=1 Tax=Nevskia soli TaxID=418856 RepID=UPI001C5CA319|nr:hypothetical protein [Nevskia soli]